jgi:hypothetical protein
VVQPFEVAALALPVADGIIDEFQLADAAEIGDRKHGVEDGLQSDVVALIGQQVHLQKPLVGFFWTSIRFGIGIEVLIWKNQLARGQRRYFEYYPFLKCS